MFHDNFIRACVRVFFKTDPPGAFARAHQSILDLNGWEHLSQEILISTPRRFGCVLIFDFDFILIVYYAHFSHPPSHRKTISVSMFAAAMLYSAPSMELSIYSTCKRISQKLLRNVQFFLGLIHEGMGDTPMREIRCNMEEMVLQGPEGPRDIRKVNSYPSKVCNLFRNQCVFYVNPRDCFSLQLREMRVHEPAPALAHVKVVVAGDGHARLKVLLLGLAGHDALRAHVADGLAEVAHARQLHGLRP